MKGKIKMIKTRIEENRLDTKQTIIYIKDNEFKLSRILKRGDIISIDFGINVGREKSGIRPAIVLSDAVANKRSENIIVAPTTAYVNRIYNGNSVKLLPSQFILSKKFYRQLDKTSIVQLEDIRSVSKKRINNFLGDLSDRSLKEMNDCLKRTLID